MDIGRQRTKVGEEQVARSIGGTRDRILEYHLEILDQWKSIRSPVLIGGLEAIACIDMLKRPPSSVSGKLAASQTIGLSMGRNGSQKVEEVENNIGTCIGIAADRNESRESVAGHIRI